MQNKYSMPAMTEQELKELVELANLANIAGQGTPQMADFRVTASPDNILAIAEAFRSLEQRVEAAEAKLADLEKQEPAGKWIVQYSATEDGYDRHSFASWRGSQPENNAELFTRPAPAVSLAELVPDEATDSQFDGLSISKAKGWNACRAAILRRIEEAK